MVLLALKNPLQLPLPGVNMMHTSALSGAKRHLSPMLTPGFRLQRETARGMEPGINKRTSNWTGEDVAEQLRAETFKVASSRAQTLVGV